MEDIGGWGGIYVTWLGASAIKILIFQIEIFQIEIFWFEPLVRMVNGTSPFPAVQSREGGLMWGITKDTKLQAQVH